MDVCATEYDVVIVGGGYSGTMVAVHLAQARRRLRVALIERGKTAGTGVAYGTADPKHLLNVQAGLMGAFPDDPGHFYRWARAHPRETAAAGVGELRPDAYLPRMLYGEYIRDLLRQARELPGAVEVIHDEIVDLSQRGDGGYEAVGWSGRRFKAARVVLALGNFPPGESNQPKNDGREWFMNNPYAPGVHAKLAEPGDVLIIGTGLTSLDVLLTLDKTKREGKIHLLSRRGLFPQPHKKSPACGPFLDAMELPETARGMLRRVRGELRAAAKRGVDWRPVVDSLRPLTQDIWSGWNAAERNRFLRHLQPIWDTHRHRCAPEIMAVKQRLETEQRLVCHRGYIEGMRPDSQGVQVTYRPRGTNGSASFHVRHVLSCTGPQADYRKLNDPLVQRLLARDLLAPDSLRLGANTRDGGQICNQAGCVIPGLYTLGSTQRGRLYESIAVPELRVQAAALAARLARDFEHTEGRPGSSTNISPGTLARVEGFRDRRGENYCTAASI